MARTTAFMTIPRKDPVKRRVAERITDFKEFETPLPPGALADQAARCMDCGIPHCHSYGCPLNNRIPDWNEMVHTHHWKQALELLHSTNNFPELTGRICPAPCETACTLAINQSPVCIRQIECAIVERGWQEGWIKPQPAARKSGKRVAIIGSGPAGLAAAQQLARYGHQVIVFERNDRIGGLLRYGIPDFKLEKWILDRRLEQLRAEGVIFETAVEAGTDLSLHYMQRSFDAIILAIGASVPRDLTVPGRELEGIHFAMDFLCAQNHRSAGRAGRKKEALTAYGKQVVIIGGGDTGSDCAGTCIRQGAARVTQIELLPKPPKQRTPDNPWPVWPSVLRTTSSHEEGCERLWSLAAKEFIGTAGHVQQIRLNALKWRGTSSVESDKPSLLIDAALVLLAMGFLHAERTNLMSETGLKTSERGNILADQQQMSSVKGLFAAGDAVLGASLVVRAIAQGCQAAAGVQNYLNV